MTTEQIRKRAENTVKVFIWFVGIYATISIAILGYCFSQIVELNVRVARIEANRFTAHDGLQLKDALIGIQKEVSALPKEVPPSWFVAKVDRLEGKVERLHEKMEKLHSK